MPVEEIILATAVASVRLVRKPFGVISTAALH